MRPLRPRTPPEYEPDAADGGRYRRQCGADREAVDHYGCNALHGPSGAFDTQAILDGWEHLPYQALNLPFIKKSALDFIWERIDDYLEKAGLPPQPVPIAGERAIARRATASAKP